MYQYLTFCELKWIDLFNNSWIFPKMEIFDRVSGYNNEGPYFRMGYSYKLNCTGQCVIRVENRIEGWLHDDLILIQYVIII